ncbi:MAG: hypothetical protein ABW056_03980 [Thermoanaerobaculia bacterium]
MNRSRRFAAHFLAGGFVLAAAAEAVSPVGPIGPEAVWKPPADFRAKVNDACASAGEKFGACFVDQMRAAGASDVAIAFARRTDDQGYATAFLDAGKVDIAYAELPFRANENALIFLVNGEPPLIDVDDLSRIDMKNLGANPVYVGLLKTFPSLALFPGERRPGGREPRVLKLRSGGQRFVVVYELHDGCHACKTVGYARIGFDFDVQGKFVGTDVVQVRPRYQ